MSKPCVSVFPNYYYGVSYIKESLRNLIFSELIAWSRSNVDPYTSPYNSSPSFQTGSFALGQIGGRHYGFIFFDVNELVMGEVSVEGRVEYGVEVETSCL